MRDFRVNIISYCYINGGKSNQIERNRETDYSTMMGRYREYLLKYHNANEIYFTYKKLK